MFAALWIDQFPSATNGRNLKVGKGTLTMNYKVNTVEQSNTGGFGFSITDSRSAPLVHFEFEKREMAIEAQRVIGQAIAIATKITPAR